MMNSTLPPEEYQKEQEVIRREFAMGLDDPDAWSGLRLFGTAYQRTSVPLSVIGEIGIYKPAYARTGDASIQNALRSEQSYLFVAGDVDAEKCVNSLPNFSRVPGEITKAALHS